MNGQSLQALMHQLKRRSMIVAVFASAGWGLAGAVLLMVLCVWADLVVDLPGPVRAGSIGVSIAMALLIVGRLAWLARRETSSATLARRLDDMAEARGQIISGIDLMRTHAGRGNVLTAGLSRIAVDRAAALAGELTPDSIAPTRPIVNAFLALGILVLATAVIGAAMPRLAHTQWMRFTDPYGDHPPYARVRFDVEPGNTRVVYGAAQDIRAAVIGADGELDSVNLILSGAGPDESLPMFPEGSGKWRATVSNVTGPARYSIRSGSSRTEHFQIDVITVPRIDEVRFRITPPAYTHRPPIEGPLPQGGIAGLPGTVVQVWARSNRPLAGGSLQMDVAQGLISVTANVPSTQPAQASNFDLHPVGSGASEVTASFVVRSAGKLKLTVTDAQNQPSTDSFAAPITLLHDEKPFVRILEPQPESFATPAVALNVQILAEDDYGITHLQLFRGLDESRSRPTDVPVGPSQPTRSPASVPLNLSDYGLAPGNVVKLYARVEDNDPAGPKGSESPIVTVHIISQEQMQQMMLTRDGLDVLVSKYDQAARRLEAATQRLEELVKQLGAADPGKAVDPQTQDEIKKLAEQVRRDAEELKKLSDQDLPFDLDKSLKKYLEQTAESMRQAAVAIGTVGSAAPAPANGDAAKRLEAIRKQLAGERQSFARGAQDPLDYLSHVYPLIEDQQRFVELYQQQRNLAERMRSLVGQEGKDDPLLKGRMRDMEQEQQKLRQDLKSLLDDIDEHADQVPPDARLDDLRQTAKQFAAAVRKSTASDQMSSAQAALEEFAGGPAHEAAQGAADTLEQFLAKAGEMGEKGKASMKFQPGLADGLGNTVEQLLGAEGFGKGSGAGQGGYSMRRNSLRNVGLYGSIPLRGQQAARANGGHAQRGVADRSIGGAGEPGAGNGQGADRLRASGQSDASVPPEYRRRVSEYFQRVADELDQDQRQEKK